MLRRTAPLLACLMSAVLLETPAADKTKSITFQPAADVFVRQGKSVSVGDRLLALSSDGNYVALAKFDTSLLKLVGPYDLHGMSLRLSVQFVRRRSQGAQKGALLAVHRMLRPWPEEAAAWPDAPSLRAGADYETNPWLTAELPKTLKVGDEIVVSGFERLGGKAKVLAAFERGVALRLIPRRGDAIVQVNVHSREARKPGPALVLKIKPEHEQLALRPPTRIIPGQYVVARDGHFYLAGKRIKFWGINLQAGAFKTYEAVDNIARRVRNMGFNAVRVWPTSDCFYTAESARQKRFYPSRRGDGSPTDVYDYMIYRLKQEGLFVHNTALGYVSSTLREHWPGLSVRYKQKGRGYDPFHYNGIPMFRYVDDAYLQMSVEHIRNYLGHRNPYTGKRYAEEETFATWELTNENHFVDSMLRGPKYAKLPRYFKAALQARWTEWLKGKYGTTEALRAAWGELGGQESLDRGIEPGPCYEDASKFPEQRGRDFVEFVTHRCIECSRRLEAVARAQAPAGVGINIAPIAHNTHADLNLHAHYAHAQGDFVSVANYQTRYTKDKTAPHYPWRPLVAELPSFYNFNYGAVAGKPFVVYESSFFRPRPYRAEFAPVMAALAAGLDWDAVYFYTLGQPWAIAPLPCGDLDFCKRPLAIPYGTSHDAYCTGFHHGNDEVFMATLALAGRAFLSDTIKPCANPLTVTYGRPALFDPAMRAYHPRGEVLYNGKSRQVERLYVRFFPSSIRSRLRLAFDPRSSVAVAVAGELAPMDDRSAVRASESILWDRPRQRLVIDTPNVKLVTGFFKDGHEFRDGVTVEGLSREFATFGLAALDGKPIAESRDILLALVSKSANTGYAFDPSKMGSGPVGHIMGIVDRGRWPIVVERVAARVHLPLSRAERKAQGAAPARVVTRYNFALYPYAEGRSGSVIAITEDEPLFLARIRRHD